MKNPFYTCLPSILFITKEYCSQVHNFLIVMSWIKFESSWMAHCKDKMPKIETLKLKIWNKYSQKRNIGVSVPFSTFMCLWANYIFPRWVCLFCWRKYVDRSWEYINRSQTHECGNWGWGRAIPRKGIYSINGIAVVVHPALPQPLFIIFSFMVENLFGFKSILVLLCDLIAFFWFELVFLYGSIAESIPPPSKIIEKIRHRNQRYCQLYLKCMNSIMSSKLLPWLQSVSVSKLCWNF